ncbi:MAG: RNase J family beta-CASP ribonuclease [Candidatus Syntropharchaeia archaeon]
MSDLGIVAIGGYNGVGRNMTALRVRDEIVILDMGLRLDRVQIHEDVEIEKMHSLDLIEMGAIPDDTVMNRVDGSVCAIVCTHGHLDHIGAVPKLAHRYNAPIIGTPFTIELISQQMEREKKFQAKNPLHIINAGETYQITPNIEMEFIRVQHSIPDSVFAVFYTPVGTILYANDFKIDRTPILDEPSDMERLKRLGREGVTCMIVESIRVGVPGKTPSEQIAKDLVFDVLLGTEEPEAGILVTTFSSHIARISSFVEAAEKMGRKPILLGRSMDRYFQSAKQTKYLDYPGLTAVGERRQIDETLRRIMKEGKENYLPIMTGHQGEPGAVLTRIASKDTPFEIEKGDKIIFSAGVIPTPVNESNRFALETKLRMKGARIYDNVHVSGHASREDHWELLRIIQPEHVIPTHGDLSMIGAYVELAEEVGYILGENVHIIRNGQELFLE